MYEKKKKQSKPRGCALKIATGHLSKSNKYATGYIRKSLTYLSRTFYSKKQFKSKKKKKWTIYSATASLHALFVYLI
jgi:hypothetical protein